MKYSEIADALKSLPITWYPALIDVILRAAIEKGVFAEPRQENAKKFCGKSVDRAGGGAPRSLWMSDTEATREI